MAAEDKATRQARSASPSQGKAEPADIGVDLPEPVAEVLKNVPEEDREDVIRSFEMIGSYSPESTLLKKITSEHITTYLKSSEENMRLGYTERKSHRTFVFFLVAVALAVFTVWIFLLKDNPNLLSNLITCVVSLLAGAFGGYGFGKQKRDSGD